MLEWFATMTYVSIKFQDEFLAQTLKQWLNENSLTHITSVISVINGHLYMLQHLVTGVFIFLR